MKKEKPKNSKVEEKSSLDYSLIEYNSSLTAEERLLNHQRAFETLQELLIARGQTISMEITKISDPKLKSEICNKVLRSLPLWFGIEAAIVDYVNDVQMMETWVVYDHGVPIGFVSINKHFPKSAEIHVMGILQEYHRMGIGHQLLQVVEKELQGQGVQFLTVKTLSESRPNKEYDQTRKFYLKAGFAPLEEFKTLWGEANPCLLLVKAL